MKHHDELLTLKEFAKRTNYSIQTIYNQISSGKLTAEHGLVQMPGGRRGIDWQVWSAWLQARREAIVCAK